MAQIDSTTIDQLGSLSAQIKSLQKQYDDLAKTVKGIGPGIYLGSVFKATVYNQTQTRIDQDAVRDKLGEAWCKRHSKVTTSTYLRVEPSQDTINKLAAQVIV